MAKGRGNGMAVKYDDAQRRMYLHLTERVGQRWLEVFEGDTEFYSAAYWDLLTGLWRTAGPLRKTGALGLMKGIKSPHTAGKVLDAAIRRGIVVERENPGDARSRLVTLSPAMAKRLDKFFDAAVGEMRRVAREVEDTGPGKDD